MVQKLDERIAEFKERIKTDGSEFCHELFEWATIRLLAHKYAYYVANEPYIKDITYDGEEKSWYVMGRALGVLKEDETSPCIDFDLKHPLAQKGIKLAKELM